MPHLPSSRRQIQPPELFVRAALASWPKCEEKNGTTIIPLEFSPRQRALVVVPAKAQAPDRFAGRNFPPGQTAETLTSPRQADAPEPLVQAIATPAGAFTILNVPPPDSWGLPVIQAKSNSALETTVRITPLAK